MIRDDLTPEQLALAAAEGTRFAAARKAEESAQPNVAGNVQREVREPPEARNVTLVAVHQLEIEGRVFHHGSEIMPGLFAQETLAKLLDQGRVRETNHRSLYRIFSVFSGCSQSEPLTPEELNAYALPP